MAGDQGAFRRRDGRGYRCWRQGWWAAAVLVCLAGGVAADPPTSGTFYGTATVEERAVDRATAAVTVLDREAIEASGARTAGEVLRLLPGIHLLTAGTRGGFTVAQIRGGDPNFTLVLLDGVPLNDSTDQVGGAVQLEALPAQALERVEVVRGPVSSLYGSTGLAGVVHLFTRRSRGAETAMEGRVEGGDAAFRGGSLTLLHPRYSVVMGYDEEAERIADERFEGWNVQATAGFLEGAEGEGGPRLRLAARGALWRGLDYPDASGGPRLGAFSGPEELRESEHREASLSLDWQSRSPLGEGHRVLATLYRHTLDRSSPAVFPLVPPSVEATTFTRARLGWSTQVVSRERTRLAIGADVEHEDGDNESLLLLPPFLGGAVTGDYRVRRWSGGPYLELLHTPDAAGRVLLEVGARLDLADGDGAEGVGEAFSPRVGVSWRLPDGTRLRGSVARAFKLPSFFATASPRALGGNPELRPESAWSGEVGLERRFGERVEVAFSLFETRYEDLIDFDFATFLHVNRSEVTARGGEFTLGWRPAAPWRVDLAVTRQDVEDRATGEGLRHRPEWLGGLAVTWRPRPPWWLRLDLQSVASMLDAQIPVPARDSVPGYTLLGAAVRWHGAGPWTLTARGDNLLDERYETFIGFPGAGRSFRVGLGYRLGHQR